MRVAVIGGGLFGCTAAVEAARAGHEVHLFEAKNDILRGASGHNQARLHEGYHYPRSPETVRACQNANHLFRKEYGKAVVKSDNRFYSIARDSKTDPWEYIEFCRRHGLEHQHHEWPRRLDGLQLTLKVKEDAIDVDILRGLIAHKLLAEGVKVRFGAEPVSFDRYIIATYGQPCAPGWCKALVDLPKPAYQFEVCEAVVIRLPEGLEGISIVIMDGEFCCLDPIAGTDLHMLSHVKHSIHATNDGFKPAVPRYLDGLLNAGIVHSSNSKVGKILKESARYMPFLNEAEYEGSIFTVKAVLSGQDATDARPTLIEQVDDRVVRIFSGKMGTCVKAAQDALELIEGRALEAA